MLARLRFARRLLGMVFSADVGHGHRQLKILILRTNVWDFV